MSYYDHASMQAHKLGVWNPDKTERGSKDSIRHDGYKIERAERSNWLGTLVRLCFFL